MYEICLSTLSLAWFFFFHIEFRTMWVSTRKLLVICMNRNQHIFSARSTILLLQMTERNQWVLMFEHNGSKFFFEVAFYHSTFYVYFFGTDVFAKYYSWKKSYMHMSANVPWKGRCIKIRMVLQKRFLPIVLKSGNLAPFMEMGYFHVPKVPLMLTLRCQLWKSH